MAKAADATDPTRRSLWLARAADAAIRATAVLVGGTAVNLHTGQYQPTDIDLCAYLDSEDREQMVSAGFEHIQGDHFRFTFSDGEEWLVEFPDSVVDGQTETIQLDTDNSLRVISMESLIVDRVRQATHGGGTNLDEAVRLVVALGQRPDWPVVSSEIDLQNELEPSLDLKRTYDRILEQARRISG